MRSIPVSAGAVSSSVHLTGRPSSRRVQDAVIFGIGRLLPAERAADPVGQYAQLGALDAQYAGDVGAKAEDAPPADMERPVAAIGVVFRQISPQLLLFTLTVQTTGRANPSPPTKTVHNSFDNNRFTRNARWLKFVRHLVNWSNLLGGGLCNGIDPDNSPALPTLWWRVRFL